jgi:hypothetical protein
MGVVLVAYVRTSCETLLGKYTHNCIVDVLFGKEFDMAVALNSLHAILFV